jgi:hypothetical protein
MGECMKIRVFKFKKDNEKNTVLENILFSTCILCFAVLVLVQIVLAVPSFRSMLNLNDKSMGMPLNGDEYLYNQGQMTLKLISEEPDPTLKILVNGDNVAEFENTEMSINVKDGDVVEIDGSQSLIGHIVKVESITTNINDKCKNASANVSNTIKMLVKVQID